MTAPKPTWPDSVIWWHCYPLGFVGAERHRIDHIEHRLGRLGNWLGYLIELGANGLLLGPIFDSASHGYDTLDHYRIDARLGDEADFDALLAATKARGVRVLLDGVFNHVSADHEIVTRAIASGPGSVDGDWIRWVDGYPRGFEGNLDLVELNLANPAVQDYVVDVMSHWLDRGIDGWRLDAAYAPGADAWAPIVARVRADHPDAWLLAEVIHGDYAGFQAASGVDSVTQYELWKAIWSSLSDRNPHELAWSLQRHAEFCESFRPQTFLGNHDVTRIATRLDDPARLRLATVLLGLLPGVPSVYAGDEQGFTGEKTENSTGDDAVRPPFPEDPAGLLGFGRPVFEHYQEVLGLRRRHPWLVSARLTVAEVTQEGLAIELSGDGGRLGLALNFTDRPVVLHLWDAEVRIDGCDYRVVG
ncbi:MAG: alpha-amylase family protein [Propionibacteriaceae bacterium]|nr:alpha-amylase family protein [Propionibacteriaceae bacterium]